MIINPSIGNDIEWTQDGLTFTELIRQEYSGNNCTFSAGRVAGHPIDTVYLRWGKDEDSGGMLLLRPDEAAAIAWVLTGVLHVVTQGDLPDE